MLSKFTSASAVVGCFLLATQSCFAQGTASAPSTAHVIDPSTNVVWIGGPNDTINGPAPQPIDLDPNGLPWRKGISTGPNATFGGGTLFLRETILNVGDEPWTDWHEINANIGSHGTIWGTVSDVRVNGTSIGFSSVISATTIDLFNFSTSVQPGDTLEIDKTLEALTDNVAGPNTLVASILQFPTGVPEPGALMLTCFAGALNASRSRRRSAS